MFTPLVSITIPIYNGARFLFNTLESIFAQTYKNYEIVIIIDGTHDDSENIIHSFQTRFPNVIRYQWQKNMGLTKTRNALIKMAQGKYIALIDQDDTWKENKLEKQMALFAKDPALGVVYSGCTYIDEQGTVVKEYLPKMYNGFIFSELFESYFIPCPSIVFRKDITEKIGLFDPAYRYAEEADFMLRAALFYPFAYVPGSTCSYRFHDKNTSRDEALADHENYVLKKNIYRFAKQHAVMLPNEFHIQKRIVKLFLVHIRSQMIKFIRTVFTAKEKRT